MMRKLLTISLMLMIGVSSLKATDTDQLTDRRGVVRTLTVPESITIEPDENISRSGRNARLTTKKALKVISGTISLSLITILSLYSFHQGGMVKGYKQAIREGQLACEKK